MEISHWRKLSPSLRSFPPCADGFIGLTSLLKPFGDVNCLPCFLQSNDSNVSSQTRTQTVSPQRGPSSPVAFLSLLTHSFRKSKNNKPHIRGWFSVPLLHCVTTNLEFSAARTMTGILTLPGGRSFFLCSHHRPLVFFPSTI